MAKLIKKGTVDLGTSLEPAGDVDPNTGFVERSTSQKVISGEKFTAKAEAERIVHKAEAEGAEIIAQAKAQAQQLLQQAQTEAATLQTQAKEAGLQEGRAEGAAQLTEAIATASQRWQAIEAQLVPQVKDLAVSIARKILGKELEFHPEGVIDIVRQALSEKARLRREIFLRVNPEDLEHLREARAGLVEVLSRCKEIGLREDPDVARFGVIIETDAGIIDAQLDTQLAVLERVLKNEN
jgi:flagellar biosynthesis/type III secretory pathway protein FliH